MTDPRKDKLPEEGRQAGRMLEEAAAAEERKVEAEKGSDLKKGARRFEERAESANGEGAETDET